MKKIYTCSCIKCDYSIQFEDDEINMYEWKDDMIYSFLKQHPYGYVDMKNQIYQCPECKKIWILPKLSMYLQNPEKRCEYLFYKKYPHMCSCCKCKLIRIYGSKTDVQKKQGIELSIKGICPKCGEQLYIRFEESE